MEVGSFPISDIESGSGSRRWKKILGWGVAILVVATLAILNWPCQDIIPVYDSEQTKAEEAREVWAGVENVYLHPTLPVVVRPVKVASISGRWLGLVVVGRPPGALIDPGYGRVWQAVYARHHRGGPRTCVRIHYSWGYGSVNEDCCLPHL